MPRLRVTILTAFLAFALVGCSTVPAVTPTPIPSATPSPSPVSTTPTPTPAPVPTLQRSVVDRIGIGFTAESVRASSGFDQQSPFPTEYRIEEGGTVVFHYDDTLADKPIVSITLTDSTGTRTTKAVPAADPVDDTGVVVNGLALKSGMEFRGTDLMAAIGAPLVDRSVDREYAGAKWTVRTLEYLGLTISLIHWYPVTDPDLWTVDAVVVTSTGYRTVRGLKVGMTYGEVLRMFDTGVYVLDPYLLPHVDRLEITQYGPDGAFIGSVEAVFNDGKVESFNQGNLGERDL